MTPFAAEISRNLSRYMRNKMHVNNDSKKGALQKSLREYFNELYPKRVYFDSDTIYVMKYSSQESIEEIVPIFFACYFASYVHKFSTIEGINIAAKMLAYNKHLRIERNEAEINVRFAETKYTYPKQQDAFFKMMQKLQDMIKNNSNIFNGFVCFLTNENILWDKDRAKDNIKNSALNEVVSTLNNVSFQNLTLFPEIHTEDINLSRFQAVWLPTRNKNYNFCLGMFDEAFIRHDYLCRIDQAPNATEFQISKKNQVPVDIQASSPGNSTMDRLERMLHIERFITNSKGENWLWNWETEYMNDYSRLVMSPAIRRMKDKTQVFSFEESDFHRVRLTHSMEVANVAKLIGKGVEYTLKNGLTITNDVGKNEIIKLSDTSASYIPQILEVAGLIHDIGNPPFGHFGESTIQNFFRDPNIMHPYVRKQFESLSEQQQQDFINFDGNVQGFRILRHLGLSTDCSSFNLDKAIVCTLVKYPYSSLEGNDKDAEDCRKHKFGYFQMEEDAFIQMRESLGLEEGQRHPLAYLLEAADDICYMGSDIEDGWKLEYISSDKIKRAYKESLSLDELQEVFGEEWQDLLNRIEHKDNIISANAIQSLRIRMQRYMVKQVVDYFCANIERIVNNTLKENEHEIIENIPTTKKLHNIWDKLVQNCYSKIHGTQIQGGQILTALLKCYTEAVFCGNLIKFKEVKDNISSIDEKIYSIKLNTDTKSGMIYETISDNFRYELSPAGQFVPQSAYDKFMLVTDFVSGMTDYYATNRYEELMIK